MTTVDIEIEQPIEFNEKYKIPRLSKWNDRVLEDSQLPDQLKDNSKLHYNDFIDILKSLNGFLNFGKYLYLFKYFSLIFGIVMLILIFIFTIPNPKPNISIYLFVFTIVMLVILEIFRLIGEHYRGKYLNSKINNLNEKYQNFGIKINLEPKYRGIRLTIINKFYIYYNNQYKTSKTIQQDSQTLEFKHLTIENAPLLQEE